MLRLVDAHAHLADHCNHSPDHGFYFINTIEPEQWSSLTRLNQDLKTIVPFYGIHPWYTAKIGQNDYERLETILTQNKAGIGEIGLDYVSAQKANNFEQQITAFKNQLYLAKTKQKLVTIHCVKAWQPLLMIIQQIYGQHEKGQIKGLIHGFQGSYELGDQLIKKGLYLSFSPRIHQAGEKSKKAFSRFPLDRLLLESDLALDYDQAILKQHYQQTAQLRRVKLEELIQRINQNAKIFAHRITAG